MRKKKKLQEQLKDWIFKYNRLLNTFWMFRILIIKMNINKIKQENLINKGVKHHFNGQESII
jgi:hypothetical protein